MNVDSNVFDNFLRYFLNFWIEPCSSSLTEISANMVSNSGTNKDDCGPNCSFLKEYLDNHVLEMNELMKSFEEKRKIDDKKRANLCARIDEKVRLLFA